MDQPDQTMNTVSTSDSESTPKNPPINLANSPSSGRKTGTQPVMTTDGDPSNGSRTTEGSSESGATKTNRFVPFPASKACDICKLRKVKCAGGQPCHACRLHATECVFSRATRRQLLQAFNHAKVSPPPASGGTSQQVEPQVKIEPANPGALCLKYPLDLHRSTNMTPSFPTVRMPWGHKPLPIDWDSSKFGGMPLGAFPVDWSGVNWASPRGCSPGADTSSGESEREGQHDRLPPGSTESQLELTPTAIERPREQSNLRIRRMREDAFGNAGLILCEGQSGSQNMEFWGLTSYIGLQDLLARMLQARTQHSPEPIGRRMFEQNRGDTPKTPRADLWRWGCERYIFHNRLANLDITNPDPTFLPSGLAYRFLHEYTKVLHALFPVLDLADVNRSIDASFGTPGPTPLRPFPDTDRAPTERARDLLVLAFGAQVIGGDGDAQCPRDVAIVWSETLRRAAYTIMKELDVFEGGVDLIRLWIVYAEFGRNYGNSGAELEAANTAARSICRMGLHKRGTYEFEPAQTHDYRTVFAVCFYSEKWACLCHGVPSTLVWGADAEEIAVGLDEGSRLSTMVAVARLADQMQSLFDDLGLLPVEAGIRRSLEMYDRVLAFHAGLGGAFDAVENARVELLLERMGSEYQRVLVLFTIYAMYLQVKTLCLLPMLQVSVWRALGRSDFQVGFEMDRYIEGLADECVQTACDTIRMFERHIEMYPHTPELSLSSIFMLYAVSVIYMDVLRLPSSVASTRHANNVQTALNKLEHYQHPAATLAEAMCRDMLVNFVDGNDA